MHLNVLKHSTLYSTEAEFGLPCILKTKPHKERKALTDIFIRILTNRPRVQTVAN